MIYVPPVISVVFTDSEEYVLVATNHSRTQPVGERIFRAEPWPDIRFRHLDSESAERDAAVLRAYLDDCAAGRRKEKAGAPSRRPWWMD